MLSRFRYQLIHWLGRRPSLYFPLFQLLGSEKYLAVNSQTDIVIEGFPRSSNSFAVAAFKMSQPDNINIASHIHHPCNVIRAVKMNVPVMLLIREPIPAVISLKSLEAEKLMRGIQRKLFYYDPSFIDLFNYYYEFYECLLPFRKLIVVVTFDEVITDFGNCIKKINDFYGTRFIAFQHTPENVKSIISKRFDIGPNDLRDKIKSEVKEHFTKVYPSIKPFVDKAHKIYEKFV